MKCPVHGDTMEGKRTKYGRRWGCTEPGCTVACWDGSTSTPADDETRALRHRCHEAFDPLWKQKVRWPSRAQAYRWLRTFMDVGQNENHIGMFGKNQCLKLLAELEKVPCS